MAARSKTGAFFWRAVALTGATALVAWIGHGDGLTTAHDAGGAAAAKAPVAASTKIQSDGLTRPLVGAYYYLWNPDNLVDGTTTRSHLVPPQVPPAALVNSQSPQTAARDIANAHKAGIDFFALDWWPYDPGYSGRDYRQADAAMADFLAAPDLREMKFAMFYETWNLGFQRRPTRRRR